MVVKKKIEIGEPTLARFDELNEESRTMARMTAITLNEGGTGSTARARAYAKRYAEYRAACEEILEIWKQKRENG